MTTLRWIGLDEPSDETCVVSRSPDGTRFASTVLGSFGELAYILTVDEGWRFQHLNLSVGDRSTSLRREPEGWMVDGQRRKDLDDAEEVDISASPLTNTLPIRRLRLEVGQYADIVTAYISVPGLHIVPDPQRYTRLSVDQYLYESRDSDFTRTITVDDEGYVLRYPGLFLRHSGD